MNEPESESEWKELFARQRADDREHAPSFETLHTRASVPSAPNSSIPWRWLWPVTAAALLAIAGWIAWPPFQKRPAMSREDAAREIGKLIAALEITPPPPNDLLAWQSPTDFLLESTHIQIP
jgi:hypothetical protein